jgi:hypothetical protein
MMLNPVVTHIHDEISMGVGKRKTLLRVRLPDGSEHDAWFYTDWDDDEAGEVGVIKHERSRLLDGPHEHCWIVRPLAELYRRWRRPDGPVIELPHELSWPPNWPSSEEKRKSMARENEILTLQRANIIAADAAKGELEEARESWRAAQVRLQGAQELVDELERERQVIEFRLREVVCGRPDPRDDVK